jgi:hypothetical protein
MKSKINMNKAPLALSTTSIASAASVRVLYSIAVNMTAGYIEVIKKYIYRWIVATGTPFLKSQAPSFHHIFLKLYPAYTSLSRDTFNAMSDADYDCFVKCVKGMLHECEVSYLGMPFINLQYDMFNGPDVKNYLGTSCSFVHNFYLHVVALKLKMDNVTHK